MAKNILFAFLSGLEEATTQVMWKHERAVAPFLKTTEEGELMTVCNKSTFAFFFFSSTRSPEVGVLTLLHEALNTCMQETSV